MKAYYNKLEKKYYPEHGWSNWIWTENGVITKIFIRGIGWKKVTKSQLNNWEALEIPDLDIAQVHPAELSVEDVEKFKAYTEKYGVTCSQEFMWTCDIMKATEAHNILTFPITTDDQKWFLDTFKSSIKKFRCPLMAVLGRWSFDVVSFESYLQDKFGYVCDSVVQMSRAQFCDLYFGQGTADRLEKLF